MRPGVNVPVRHIEKVCVTHLFRVKRGIFPHLESAQRPGPTFTSSASRGTSQPTRTTSPGRPGCAGQDLPGQGGCVQGGFSGEGRVRLHQIVALGRRERKGRISDKNSFANGRGIPFPSRASVKVATGRCSPQPSRMTNSDPSRCRLTSIWLAAWPGVCIQSAERRNTSVYRPTRG